MDRKLFRDLVLLSLATSLYMIFGALVFQALEHRPGEELTPRNLTMSLERDLMQKYNATRQEIEKIIARVRTIVHQQKGETGMADWTFYSSLYFVGSVITTIGYGHISPQTAGGRVFCIFFAIMGIPLNILTLKALGDGINKLLTKLITYFERKFREREPEHLKIKTMIMSSFLMLFVLLIGGVMYTSTEDWDYLASVYYCFVVFTTIGFGDLVPNQGQAPTKDFQIAMVFVRAVVLIIGLSTLSSVLTSVVCAAEEINATLPKFCFKNHKRVAPIFLQPPKQSRDDYTDMRCEASRAPTPFQPISFPGSALPLSSGTNDTDSGSEIAFQLDKPKPVTTATFP